MVTQNNRKKDLLYWFQLVIAGCVIVGYLIAPIIYVNTQTTDAVAQSKEYTDKEINNIKEDVKEIKENIKDQNKKLDKYFERMIESMRKK